MTDSGPRVSAHDLLQAKLRNVETPSEPNHERELWRRYAEARGGEVKHFVFQSFGSTASDKRGAVVIEVDRKERDLRDLEIALSPGVSEQIAKRLRRVQVLHARVARHINLEDGRVCRRLILSAAGECIDLESLHVSNNHHSHKHDDRERCTDPLCLALVDIDQRIKAAETYYAQSAKRRAAGRYILGTIVGLIILPIVVLGLVWLGDKFGQDGGPAGVWLGSISPLTFISGGLGAMASVIQRLNADDSRLDYEAVSRRASDPIFWRGFLRVAIGGLFGTALAVIVQSDLVPIDPPGDALKDSLFFAALAFVGGFSERLAQDVILETGETVARRVWVDPARQGADAGEHETDGYSDIIHPRGSKANSATRNDDATGTSLRRPRSAARRRWGDNRPVSGA